MRRRRTRRIAHSPYIARTTGLSGFSDLTVLHGCERGDRLCRWLHGLELGAGRLWRGPDVRASRLSPAVQQITRNVLQRFVSTALSTALPPPWAQQDIGSVPLTGSGVFVGGSFIVQGNGSDIWDSADGFHFVYQPLNGDGQIVARVAAGGEYLPMG